jgi:hypothetical protein
VSTGDQTSRGGDRAVFWAGVATALGVILSGPAAMAIVQLVAPQPAWRDGALFARSLHGVQVLPYLFGFLAAGGAQFRRVSWRCRRARP